MAAPFRQYTDELYDAFRYWPTWTPGVPLALGVVGTFEDLVFVPRSNLKSFGLQFSVLEDAMPENLEYTSKGSVSIETKVKGKTSAAFQNLSKLDAGLGITFSRENATVFSARDCFQHRIDDERRLTEELLELGREAWPYEYAVITQLVVAKSGTVLISGSRGSRIEIRANADIGNQVIDLADIGANLSVAYTKEMHTQIVAAKGLTPLFRALRIQRNWWTGEDVVEDAVVAFGSPEFEEVTYEDEVEVAGS